MKEMIFNHGDSPERKRRKKTMKRGKYACLIIMIVVISQWLLFYVYSRLNSILTSFQYFDGMTETYKLYSFQKLFTNYGKFFSEIAHNPHTMEYIGNGYLFWLASAVVSEFSIIIAYYLYKKCFGSPVMLICLMLPSTLAGMTNPLMFKYFAEKALPAFAEQFGWKGDFSLLFSRQETALTMSLVMSSFLAFPGSMLFYVGQFGRTPVELVESAKLDGITFMKEFWYISFPSIFGMWSLGHLTILTLGLTSAGPGYALYADKGYKYGVVTFQYDILINVMGGGGDPRYYYPYSAAVNMVLALLTLAGIGIMKRVWDRLDPQAEY